MKIYEVTTEHVARFTYRVEAENEDDAGAAAFALMDAEITRADVGDIEYEGDVAEVQDADDGHGHVFNAAEVIAASEKDVEHVERIIREAY